MADPRALRDDAVALLQRLVACDTSNPPGDEAQAAGMLEAFFDGSPVSCERVAKDQARPNLIARIRGNGGGPSLAFLTHLDVVQARREDWTVEPFSGAVKDGAIWGRGTVDMKCQVAAVAVALRALATSGFRPSGDVMLLALADEEVGDAGVGAPFLVEQRPDLRPDFVVGEGAGERFEAPNGPLYLLDHGVKCTSTATLTVRGRALDASLPVGSTNAAYELARLLARLEQHESPVRVREEVRPLLMYLAPDAANDVALVEEARKVNPALGTIIGALVGTVIQPTIVQVDGPANVVPEIAKAELQCITLPGTSRTALESELRSALGSGDYDLHVTEPEGGLTSPLGTILHESIAKALATHDPDATLVPSLGYGFSDCHTLRQAYQSVAYGFIPFRYADPKVNLTTKHAADERVLIEDLAFQVQIAQDIARGIGAATSGAGRARS
jgi:acetylornithine deacetylase/succinyl-diaminopimelate desuccinylase-like protein